MVVAVVGCLLLVYRSPLHAMLVPDELRRLLAGFGAWAPAMFVLACALAIGVGAPRLAFAAAGGLLFGWWGGALLAQAGTILGCAITFLWARQLGGDLALRKRIELLDADDGELTRTRKVRRRFIGERFDALVAALYAGKDAVHVTAQVKYEDGRTGTFSADLKIRDAKTFAPAAARKAA